MIGCSISCKFLNIMDIVKSDINLTNTTRIPLLLGYLYEINLHFDVTVVNGSTLISICRVLIDNKITYMTGLLKIKKIF